MQFVHSENENFIETQDEQELLSLKNIYSKEMFWERISVFLDNNISKKVLQAINNVYDHCSSEIGYGLAVSELKNILRDKRIQDFQTFEKIPLS
jgi:hypothetical protein